MIINDARGDIIIIRHGQMPALRLIALAVLTVCGSAAHAVGVGTVSLQSALGQPLHASIPIIGNDNDVSTTCIKARVESSDGAFVVSPQIVVMRSAQGATIALTSRQVVNEPAVTITVDVGCTAPIHRQYQVLLDPPYASPVLAQLPPQAAERGAVANGLPPQQTQANQSAETASSIDGSAQGVPRKGKVRRATRGPATAMIGADAQPSPISGDAPIRTKARKSQRDARRLSGEERTPVSRLKLSDTLSEPAPTTAVDPRTAEATKAARQQFDAVMRGEDPLRDTEAKVKAAQAQVQELQAQIDAIKHQSQNDRAALNEIRDKSYPSVWLAALGGLLLLALGAIAGLLWHARSMKKHQAAWWEQNFPRKTGGSSGDTVAPDSRFNLERGPDFEMQNEPVAASDSIYRSMQPGARDTTVSAQLSSQWNKNLAFGLPTLESTNSSSLNPYSVKTHALNVEEISDVTQEAEFWMSLNDPQRALEILEPQSDVASPDSPVPWLYLLDLYRDMGSEDKYNALRDRFQLIFNAHIPIFKEDVLTLRPRSLEDFPNLMGRICDAWNTDGIMPFLESLLIDDRDGARVGFDLPVYREILMLIAIVRELDRALAIEFPGADLAKLKAAIHRPHQKPTFRWKDPEGTTPEGTIDFEPVDFKIDIQPQPPTE
ncbi:FimV family protein [Undibacterium arcticum]|uniref:FimV family protein n=1 Tax=Undibacterium arcticum TaxID=1762892 RepID=A0ABV7F1K6_9BURK